MRASSLGLGPERRLRERKQFLRFYGKSESKKLGECIVFRLPNVLGYFRLGITLKARGSSIERNRVKRVVREAMRSMSNQLGSSDFNVVIPASRRIDRLYAVRLRRALLGADWSA